MVVIEKLLRDRGTSQLSIKRKSLAKRSTHLTQPGTLGWIGRAMEAPVASRIGPMIP